MTQRQRRLLHPPKLIQNIQTVTTGRNACRFPTSILLAFHPHAPCRPDRNQTPPPFSQFGLRTNPTGACVVFLRHQQPLIPTFKRPTTHMTCFPIATGLPTLISLRGKLPSTIKHPLAPCVPSVQFQEFCKKPKHLANSASSPTSNRCCFFFSMTKKTSRARSRSRFQEAGLLFCVKGSSSEMAGTRDLKFTMSTS